MYYQSHLTELHLCGIVISVKAVSFYLYMGASLDSSLSKNYVYCVLSKILTVPKLKTFKNVLIFKRYSSRKPDNIIFSPYWGIRRWPQGECDRQTYLHLNWQTWLLSPCGEPIFLIKKNIFDNTAKQRDFNPTVFPGHNDGHIPWADEGASRLASDVA